MKHVQMSPTSLGETGPLVSPLALGCMGLSGMYGPSRDDVGIATIQAALDAGITLLDTGDFYGMGQNEMLIAKAIEGRRQSVQLSVKFGALRAPDGSFVGVDNRPAAVKNFAAYSLKRLGADVIDIYRPARLDPNVPIEDTIGAVADLVKQGYVRHIGLSEVGVQTVQRANAVHPICDVQIEYSLVSRRPEESLFPALQAMGISATLYGVLSRGLLSGRAPTGPGDFRAHLPRFSGDNGAQNQRLVQSVRQFAADRGQTAAALCLAWALAKQPNFVPLIGPRTPQQLEELLAALAKPLTTGEVQELETLVPAAAIAGSRYAEAHMAHLDSER
ncbi:MAG: aldo/keto reductase [Deltaproteobacteria bacterium]|nr:aldo/keto reductase [Deltaproteobacteria bacterium]